MIHVKFKCLFVVMFLISGLSAQAQHKEIPATDAFTISGAVKNELRFTIGDLLQFPQDTLGAVSVKDKQGREQAGGSMKGVLLKTLLDSAHVFTAKHKDYNELCIMLIAADDYRNVYSWNELFNTEVGNHVYVITAMDGKPMSQMDDRILVMSLADIHTGRRHMKGLARIEVKKLQ